MTTIHGDTIIDVRRAATGPMVTERKHVRIERSPPRRVLAKDRYRTFKTQADRDIWAACLVPIDRLKEDGWRIVGVTVDWGPARPMTERWREQTVRDLFGCYDGCQVKEAAGNATRGSTVVEMERDRRET